MRNMAQHVLRRRHPIEWPRFQNPLLAAVAQARPRAAEVEERRLAAEAKDDSDEEDLQIEEWTPERWENYRNFVNSLNQDGDPADGDMLVMDDDDDEEEDDDDVSDLATVMDPDVAPLVPVREDANMAVELSAALALGVVPLVPGVDAVDLDDDVEREAVILADLDDDDVDNDFVVDMEGVQEEQQEANPLIVAPGVALVDPDSVVAMEVVNQARASEEATIAASRHAEQRASNSDDPSVHPKENPGARIDFDPNHGPIVDPEVTKHASTIRLQENTNDNAGLLDQLPDADADDSVVNMEIEDVVSPIIKERVAADNPLYAQVVRPNLMNQMEEILRQYDEFDICITEDCGGGIVTQSPTSHVLERLSRSIPNCRCKRSEREHGQ